MIQALLNGIFTLITNLVSLILTPIDLLIENALPDLQTGLNAIGSFLSICVSSVGWVLSVFGLSSTCLSLIVLYFVFKLTLPLLVHTIKLAIKWYNALKP